MGLIGHPKNMEDIKRLRAKLSSDIYMWINKIDGYYRDYTGEEIDQFKLIDPYFLLELSPLRANTDKCLGGRSWGLI